MSMAQIARCVKVRAIELGRNYCPFYSRICRILNSFRGKVNKTKPKSYDADYKLYSPWETHALPKFLMTDGGKEFTTTNLKKINKKRKKS